MVIARSPEIDSRTGRGRRFVGAVGLLAALLACPACSHATCAGPARLPPTVFVRADALLQERPGSQVSVCAADCLTFSSDEDQGELGPQLVITGGDDRTPITLRATVSKDAEPPVLSTLTVRLAKGTTVSDCGSFVSYEAFVHLDATGQLQPGPS